MSLREPGEIARRIADAWNVHDAGAFAALFAKDADFTNVFGMEATGRAEIERFHAPVFETMFKESVLSVDGARSRMLREDVATVDLRWSMTGARDPMGREWARRRGLISLVMSRENGDWLIASMHNMDLPDSGMAEAQQRVRGGEAIPSTSPKGV
ncbi:SgcJ/EcaC family oxidoreductase [Mesorhizobium sp. CC13]|uniref:SgcJ/EcaC family oxidoreductase n=1 Tax=Mesorhizobium sp. CC13 TaxID=3029194 RepID=UPI0032666EFE